MKVQWLIDNTYQVVDEDGENTLFQGDISECNAWLQLNDKNYFERC